jgi:hypothetical protein
LLHPVLQKGDFGGGAGRTRSWRMTTADEATMTKISYRPCGNKQSRICRVGHSDSPPMTAIATPNVLAAARTRALNASNPSPALRSSCVSPTLPYVGSPPSRPPRMIISVGSFCVVCLSSADRRACHLCVSPSSQPGFAPPILPGALQSRLAQGCAADIPLGHQERDPHPVSGTRSRPPVRLRQRPPGGLRPI